MAKKEKEESNYHPYNLDHKAQELVLKYRDRDVLNESHKMRATVAYGLERFWGEHLRLMIQARKSDGKEDSKALNKGNYWKDTWKALVEIMKEADIKVPNDEIKPHEENSTKKIEAMAKKLWGEDEKEPFPEADRKIALVVLTQLCDSLVWWTQRYKKASDRDNQQSTNKIKNNPRK